MSFPRVFLVPFMCALRDVLYFYNLSVPQVEKVKKSLTNSKGAYTKAKPSQAKPSQAKPSQAKLSLVAPRRG
jgi:hypothetical protein